MLVLLLICAMWIVPVAAEKYVEVDTFDKLKSEIASSTSNNPAKIVITADFSLTEDITIFSGYGPIILTVPLNTGHTLARGGSLQENFFTIDGGGLTIQDNGSGVLTLDGMDVPTTSESSLIYLQNKALLTMNGGNLTNNTDSSYYGGAAVHVGLGCRFTMNDGTITGNHAPNGAGGGVYVDSAADFVMTGGVISKNTASNGAGVYVSWDGWSGSGPLVAGTFTMSGGKITENTAGGDGGGVTIGGGTCTISGDAEITKNSAANQGGGVNLKDDISLFTMNGGEIAENTADWSGGGIYIGGAVVMRGGTITKNQIVDKGGGGSGVADYGVTSPSFTMTGGTISGNGAVGEGEFHHAGTKLTVGGTAVIDTTSTYIGGAWNSATGITESLYITVLSNFTGCVRNITPDYTTHGAKLVEFPAGTDESKFEGKLTLAQSVIDKNKKLIFFPEDLPVLRIQKAQDVGIIDGVLGDGSSSGKYAAGEKVTVTASIPHGKKFLRWAATNITLTETEATTSPLTFTMPALPVTLTASFEDAPETPTPTPAQTSPSEGNMDNAFRALFDAQGGTFTQPAAGLSYGDKITLPVSPEKSGVVFAGWYTEAACIHPWNFDDATVKGDMTLYAKWTPATATTSPTAAVTTPVTAPPTQTIVPTVTGTADPVPTTQPSVSETKNPEIPAGGDTSPLVIAGGIVIAGVLILAALFLLLRRHTVQFLIPTIAGTESYTIRVGHKKSIPRDRLPDFITRQTWYRDELRQIPWDFDEDVVTEQMTLYPGYR